jgi:DNA-binding transcriptional LysR family regulator
LRKQRRALRVELVATAGFLSPGRREADIAVTLVRPKDQRLSVELLTPYHLALYASPAYLAEHGAPNAPDDLRRHDLVGYVEDLIYARELAYLDEVGERLRPQLASSSIHAQRAIIAHGGGIGVLPAFLAKGLVQVLADEVRLTRHFFVTTRSEIADTARIKAVRAWLKEAAEARRGDLLLG